jgi:hypothetical protein
MAKPIPTTKPARKNNTKHQRGDGNALKLIGPCSGSVNLGFYFLDYTLDKDISTIRPRVEV